MLERFRKSFKRRSGSVNLVVHESEVRKRIGELKYSGANPDYLVQQEAVIDEIDRIRDLPETVVVSHHFRNQIGKDIGNAEEVVVYGCNRGACLNWVSEAAIEQGAAVSISIRGSV